MTQIDTDPIANRRKRAAQVQNIIFIVGVFVVLAIVYFLWNGSFNPNAVDARNNSSTVPTSETQ